MITNVNAPAYSKSEEWFNSISHGLGFLFATLGLFLLIERSEGIRESSATMIYGSSLLFMFLCSTGYHSIHNPKLKKVLKLFDHTSIYLLIAGTYTPFLLLSIGGLWGTVSSITIWSIAFLGISFKWIAKHRFPKISLTLYLIMGWIALLLIYPLYQTLPSAGLWLLILGGAFFSVGVCFYVAKHKKYAHGIWHLFVMAGCGCHFFSIYEYAI